MELVSCNTAHIHLFVILLLSTCLRVSNAHKENKIKTTDHNLKKPKVTIFQGPIRGVTLSTKNNRSVAGFLGIPYAEPPIAKLRFKAPVAKGPWKKTLDAGSDSPDCPQMSGSVVIGNEDCLYLNVYTPRLPTRRTSKLLPVMMYIHGGGFIQDSNNSTLYGPGYLLDQNVVLVVPSYRLAALGFLSTGDEVSAGNWGLKDLVLALKWIRKNIKFFGGDRNQVTILGQSAGSMAVNFLALSDSTIGLFHRYITQSSSALSTMAYQPTAVSNQNAITLGKYLGCSTNTSALLVKCLRTLDFTKILNTTAQFIEWGVYPRVTWAPTIEPNLKGAILTDSPANLLAAGKLRDLPYMVGSVPIDGIVLSGYLYAYPDKFDEFLADFDNILPYVLNYQNKVKNVSDYTNTLKSYYFDNDLTTNTSMLLSNLTQLCTDMIANFPNYIELQQSSASNSRYLYSFAYRGTYSYSYIWTYGLTEDFGVAHCDELLYLFPQSEALFGEFNTTMSESDLKMVDTMVELWTSFVINGKPKSSAMTCNEIWSPFSEQRSYLRIGNEADLSLQVKDSESENWNYFLRNLNGNFT